MVERLLRSTSDQAPYLEKAADHCVFIPREFLNQQPSSQARRPLLGDLRKNGLIIIDQTIGILIETTKSLTAF